jgi:transposase
MRGGAEIVARRRKWRPEEKVALLAEVEAERGRVSVVAKRHGISDSLLYNWRSAWKAAASMRVPEPVEFMPIGMIGRASEAESTLLAATEQSASTGEHRDNRSGGIEIDLPNGVRVRVDAFVNEKSLSRVLGALKGAV